MTLGVIYARYSEGPRQTDQSIEGQVADCKMYAEANDIEITEIYADRHISGKSVDGRDEFQRMMRDAKAHKFQALIVWKIDRFGRDRYDIANYKHELKKAGVTLHYAKEAVPDGPEGIILEALLEGLAEYYSADLRQKVSRGMRESVKKGKWPGPLPIGYMKDDEQHIIQDPVIAPLIRQAFEMYVADTANKDIIEMLKSHGVMAKHGKPIDKGTLYRIVRNERYTGAFRLMGEDIQAEPIISRELWEEAQKHHKTGRHNGAGKAVDKYTLSCKCYCGYCGKLVPGKSGTGKSGKLYSYYTCRSNDLRSFPRDDLEDLVVKATVEDMLTDDMIRRITQRMVELQDEDPASELAESLKTRLASVRKRKDNLVDLIAETGSRSLMEKLAALEAEEADLADQLAVAEVKRSHIPEHLLRGWLESFRAGDAEDAAFRKRLLETFVHKVKLWNDHIVIWYNAGDDKSGMCSHTARVVDLMGVEPMSENKFPFLLLS